MSIWRGLHPLVLASKSAVRLQLLNAAAIPAQAQPADVDERAIEQASGITDPGEVASLLAREKAFAVAKKVPSTLMVLGADQTLALGTQRFSKPADRKDARAQLVTLRGKTHTLHSAIALVQENELLFEYRGEAHMTMRNFSDSFLDRYMRETGDAVLRSVGAYQLEGPGIHFFEKVEGDYFTILGLPLFPLLDYFRRCDIVRG